MKRFALKHEDDSDFQGRDRFEKQRRFLPARKRPAVKRKHDFDLQERKKLAVKHEDDSDQQARGSPWITKTIPTCKNEICNESEVNADRRGRDKEDVCQSFFEDSIAASKARLVVHLKFTSGLVYLLEDEVTRRDFS